MCAYATRPGKPGFWRAISLFLPHIQGVSPPISGSVIGCHHGGSIAETQRLRLAACRILPESPNRFSAGFFFCFWKYPWAFLSGPPLPCQTELSPVFALFAGLCAPRPSRPRSRKASSQAHNKRRLPQSPVAEGLEYRDIRGQYSLRRVAATARLLNLASGTVQAPQQGRVVNGALVPTNYTPRPPRRNAKRFTGFSQRTSKEYAIEPGPPVDPDRIALTERQRRVRSR